MFTVAVAGVLLSPLTVAVRTTVLQEKHSLDESLKPLDLTSSFELRQRTLLHNLEGLTESLKDNVMQKLGEFVTDKVSEEVEEARQKVTDIRGKGTMDAQAAEVRRFYAVVRQLLRQALETHLRGMFLAFQQALEDNLKAIGPELTQELHLALKDRLDALEGRLVEKNEQEKARLVARLNGLLEVCKQGGSQAALDGAPPALTGAAVGVG
jgi:hypothetical protein